MGQEERKEGPSRGDVVDGLESFDDIDIYKRRCTWVSTLVHVKVACQVPYLLLYFIALKLDSEKNKISRLGYCDIYISQILHLIN